MKCQVADDGLTELRKGVLSPEELLLILQNPVQGLVAHSLITGQPSGEPLLLCSSFTWKEYPSRITLLATILVTLSHEPTGLPVSKFDPREQILMNLSMTLIIPRETMRKS